MDFNFFHHQVVAHLVDGYDAASHCNAVDGDPVPVPHFGAALSVAQFQQLAERVKAAGVHFEIEPHLRFAVRCLLQLLRRMIVQHVHRGNLESSGPCSFETHLVTRLSSRR